MISRRAAILAFCAVFFGGQLASIAFSYIRGDRLGGYQMFAETTYFTARLHRVTADGRRELARGGAWKARDATGRLQSHRWGRLVDDFKLNRLEHRTRAKIGIDVTLKFFQYALDHVARNVPADRETVRFEMVIEYVSASGARGEATLTSAVRPEAGP